ncbi:MAG: hypothetical protein ACI9HK_005987 [Pirellulaceae bacterium]|jgi:hypothetical protein
MLHLLILLDSRHVSNGLGFEKRYLCMHKLPTRNNLHFWPASSLGRDFALLCRYKLIRAKEGIVG